MLILAWINWVDQPGVTLTADSASAKLPAVNVAEASPSLPWRSSGAVSAYLQVDFGAARAIGVIAGAGLDLAATDTVRVRLGTSAGAGDVLDQSAAGTIDGDYGQWAYVLPSEQSARHLRLDVAAASRAAEGYFEWGRLWAAQAWQPAYGISFPLEELSEDNAVVRRAARSGVAVVDQTWQQRGWRFALEALSETEALDDLRAMLRAVGRHGQILFAPTADSSRIAQELVIGRLRQTNPLRLPRLPFRALAFEVEQDL